MSLKTAFRDYLLGDATITGFVSTRVFPFVADPLSPLPYIIYQRISAQHGHHFEGGDGLTRQRLQVDSYASNALTAESMADAIRERCDGFAGLMGTVNLDVRSLWIDDEDDRLTIPNKGSEVVTHRVRQDFFIWYVESVPTF